MFQLPPVLLLAAATTTTGTLFLLPNIRHLLSKRTDKTHKTNMSLDRRMSLSAEVLMALRLHEQATHPSSSCAGHQLEDENNNSASIRCGSRHSPAEDSNPSKPVPLDVPGEEENDDELEAAPSIRRSNEDTDDQLTLIGAQLRQLSDQFQRYRQKRRHISSFS